MTIEIEDCRTSDEGWRQAFDLSHEELRESTQQYVDWVTITDTEGEKLARRLYAMRATLPELEAKSKKLARIASNWMEQAGIPGSVMMVRMRCLRGVFDLRVSQGSEVHRLEVREEVLDDLLQAGSREASESLDRLFAANLGVFPLLKAS